MLNLKIYNVENLKFPAKKIDIFPFYTKIKSTLETYAAEICIAALLFESLLFLFTLFDFIFSDNPSNQFRIFIKGLTFMFKCLFRCLFPYRRNPPEARNARDIINIELSPLNQREEVLQ